MRDDIETLRAFINGSGWAREYKEKMLVIMERLAEQVAERDSLRAKLERALGRMDKVCNSFERDMRQGYKTRDKEFAVSMLRPFLSELSADAPAQPPVNYNPAGLALVREKLGRISSNFSDDPRGDADAALEALDKLCERATAPQISDVEVTEEARASYGRSVMDHFHK